MALPREVLEAVAADIARAEDSLAELKDVISDMKLSGMDVDKREDTVDALKDKLHSYKVFYERQKAKAI